MPNNTTAPSGKDSASRTASKHVYDNVDAVAAIYEKSEVDLPRGQRGIERVVAFLSRPMFLFFYVVALVVWVGGNLLSHRLGIEPLDVPPFFWLQGCLTGSSLLVTVVILIAQTRQSRLAERRAHFDLQVNLLAESKIAKVIALLEELRRDSPMIRDRVDRVADAMQKPADPELVSRALEEKTNEKP